MASRGESFDVFLIVADTVYKGVPYHVVCGWAEQGRANADDKLRPAGSTAPWMRFGDHPMVSDFLPRKPRTAPIPKAGPGQPVASVAASSLYPEEPAHAIEMDRWKKTPDDDDDDVDMIPLIDVSLVLLIFFMLTTAVSSSSPVRVPGMKNTGKLSKDPDALTVYLDKRPNGDIFYGVGIGAAGPTKENNNLQSAGDLSDRLDMILGKVSRAPEVRIACHVDLQRAYVKQVAQDLEKRRLKGTIAFYAAEVNEVKK